MVIVIYKSSIHFKLIVIWGKWYELLITINLLIVKLLIIIKIISKYYLISILLYLPWSNMNILFSILTIL